VMYVGHRMLESKRPEGINPDYICKDLLEVRGVLNNLLR